MFETWLLRIQTSNLKTGTLFPVVNISNFPYCAMLVHFLLLLSFLFFSNLDPFLNSSAMSTKRKQKVTHKKITLMKVRVNIFLGRRNSRMMIFHSAAFQLSLHCVVSPKSVFDAFSRNPTKLAQFRFPHVSFSNSVGIINNLCHRVFFHLYWSLVKENCPILLYTCSCPCCGNGSLMDSVSPIPWEHLGLPSTFISLRCFFREWNSGWRPSFIT